MASPDPRPTGHASRSGFARRTMRGLKNLIIGTLFCTTPPTAILALGWTLRDMRATTVRKIASPDRLPTESVSWLLGPRGSGFISRWFGGLWLNTKTGLGGLFGLAFATLPFTGLWILSWWAGWENSFNKEIRILAAVDRQGPLKLRQRQTRI